MDDTYLCGLTGSAFHSSGPWAGEFALALLLDCLCSVLHCRSVLGLVVYSQHPTVVLLPYGEIVFGIGHLILSEESHRRF